MKDMKDIKYIVGWGVVLVLVISEATLNLEWWSNVMSFLLISVSVLVTLIAGISTFLVTELPTKKFIQQIYELLPSTTAILIVSVLQTISIFLLIANGLIITGSFCAIMCSVSYYGQITIKEKQEKLNG